MKRHLVKRGIGRIALFLTGGLMLFFCTGVAWSGELSIETAVICTGIQDRTPVGEGTEFPASVKQLFCFTKVKGASEPTEITHVWHFEGKKVHEFTVPVKAEEWRTWTNKNIYPQQKGPWQVDIVETGTQKVLCRVPFDIQ